MIIKHTLEALRYKPEGRGFYSRWCHWKFYWHNPSGRTTDPLVDSAFKKNEYEEYFLGGKRGRCVGLTILSCSCMDCLEILELQPNGTLWASTEIALPVPNLYVITTYNAATCSHVIIICTAVSYTQVIMCTVVRYTHVIIICPVVSYTHVIIICNCALYVYTVNTPQET